MGPSRMMESARTPLTAAELATIRFIPSRSRTVDDPLFSPNEISADERIDYVASARERTIAYQLPLAVAAEEEPQAATATGTDDARSNL